MQKSQIYRLLRLSCVLCIGLLISCSQPSAEAATNTYYVSPTGKDSQKGTITSPWKTLQHAADTVPAGSTVYLREGVYKQQLAITRSGSASKGNITFTPYSSEKAVLDGTGQAVDGLQGMIDIQNASYITIKGLEIRNYTTTHADEVPTGISIQGAGSHIQITGNKIHDIKSTVSLSGNHATGRDAHGIAVYGNKAPESLHDITIDHNELYNLVLGSSESLVVNGNVEKFTISHNRLHDNDNIGIDVIGYEGTAPNVKYDVARQGVIKGNTIYNISSTRNPFYGKKIPNNSNSAGAIYVDGGKDTVIEQNKVYNNDIGIEIASEHAGKSTDNITVRSNIIFSNRLTGIAMGGYDTERGSTINSHIMNNTLYKNDTLNRGNGQLYVQYDTRNNVIKNNIMVAGASNVLIYNEYTKNSGNIIDYNLYDAPDGSAEATWIWKNKEYAGFPDYRKRSGNDAHSLFANPKLIDPAKQNFHVQQSSPAIHQGIADPSIVGTLDIDGQLRKSHSPITIGADQ